MKNIFERVNVEYVVICSLVAVVAVGTIFLSVVNALEEAKYLEDLAEVLLERERRTGGDVGA